LYRIAGNNPEQFIEERVMSRIPFLSTILGILTVATLSWASNPQADALRQQVKALRNEQKVVVKVIGASYDKALRGVRLGEKELSAEKAALHEQERQYLALTTSDDDRETIRSQYHLLQGVLSGDIHLDVEVRSRLRAQKTVLTKLVNELYKAKIAELDNLIRIASKTGRKR
jgi:hypothetical protein